jgi:hypothetical protein
VRARGGDENAEDDVCGGTAGGHHRAGAAQPRDEPTARDVLDKYSALLASLPTGRGVVRNISELPYPKTVIKIALLELLVGTNDAKERNTIEVAYIGLASFQEMTAEENEAVRKWDEIMRSDPATTSGTELAQRIVGAGDTYRRVVGRFVAERTELYNEIKKFEKSH